MKLMSRKIIVRTTISISFLALFIGTIIGCSNALIDQEASPVLIDQEASLALQASTGTGVVNAGGGSYDDFINALWIRESSIDPKQASYYAANYNKVVTEYQMVQRPGRVLRDSDGNPVTEKMTIAEYFTAIGIGDIYKVGSGNADMFRAMQAGTINFLGFVGFQFSEQDLWVLGYYEHYDEIGVPTYYTDVDNSVWANGVRDLYIGEYPNYLYHATDVNTWKGTFLNKNGIATFSDFVNYDKHLFVVKDHFQLKYGNLVDQFAAKGKKLSDVIGTKVYWDQLNPKVSPPPGGRSNDVTITMSGMLAGAHLRGAAGVVDMVVNHNNPADEVGTYILEYVQDYGGYDTPYDPSK